MRDTPKRVAARLGRNRAFRRRLPATLGGCVFPASLEGGAKYLRPDASNIDRSLTSFARDYVKPGSTVWDIGANVGLFTFAAAGLAGSTGHIVAIEPDDWLAGNLRRACSWNKSSAKVDVVSVAVSDVIGLDQLLIAKSARATNYLATSEGSATTGGVRERYWVSTLTLDALLEFFPKPDLVKIDIEGAEVAALEGATNVLALRPTLHIEVYEEHARVVDSLLKPHGYRYLDADTRTESVLPSFSTIALPLS